MTILVIGETGQVARCLHDTQPKQIQAVYANRAAFDLSKPENFQALMQKQMPKLVINAAAFTDVEGSESQEALATRINSDALGYMGEACRQMNVPLIHLSTDYVFDGQEPTPRHERHPVGPRSAYGRSKLAGEVSLLGSGARAYIFRTAWVYSIYGKNFVKTMLNQAERMDTIRVVNDQFGNPTSAVDIATALWQIVPKILENNSDTYPWGLYHMSGTGDTNWYDFAQNIFEQAAVNGFKIPSSLTPILSSEFPTKVDRPAYCCLNNEKLHSVFSVKLPDWKKSTLKVLKILREKGMEL